MESARYLIQLSKDASQDDMLAAAKSEPKVQKYLDGKSLVKEIVVPGRMINLVVK